MSMQESASPRILSFGWGKIEVDGLGNGKDFKLWPGGGREWDWNEYGTRHSRGIHVDDVNELITHNPKVIILTRGVLFRLRVPSLVKSQIEKNGIEVVVASTKQGIRLYNDYCDKGVPVAGLFHSTC